jgi:Rrf2 family protein
MQLPIKAHYATVAMLALAQTYDSSGLLTVRTIADEHDIPPQFLVQILQQLRAAGMVSSTRGSSGGFRLERDPSTISVAEIVDAICPTSDSAIPQASHDSQVPAAADGGLTLGRVVQEVWIGLGQLQQQHLRQVKLSQLRDRAESVSASMFYI